MNGKATDPSTNHLLIAGDGRKRRGRPRAATPGATITTWLDVERVDQLVSISRAGNRSVSSVVRFAVRRFLDDWNRRQT
jgi:hypothetical protein